MFSLLPYDAVCWSCLVISHLSPKLVLGNHSWRMRENFAIEYKYLNIIVWQAQVNLSVFHVFCIASRSLGPS